MTKQKRAEKKKEPRVGQLGAAMLSPPLTSRSAKAPRPTLSAKEESGLAARRKKMNDGVAYELESHRIAKRKGLKGGLFGARPGLDESGSSMRNGAYFGGEKKSVFRTAESLTRREAAFMITRFIHRTFLSKRNVVSRFDLFLVSTDIKLKHSGCWAAARFAIYTVLFFTILWLQQQPTRTVSVIKSLAEVSVCLRLFYLFITEYFTCF